MIDLTKVATIDKMNFSNKSHGHVDIVVAQGEVPETSCTRRPISGISILLVLATVLFVGFVLYSSGWTDLQSNQLRYQLIGLGSSKT